MASKYLIISQRTTALFSILILILINLLLISVQQTSAAKKEKEKEKAHLHFYMHEFLSGPNATLLSTVTAPNGTSSSRGSIAVIDDKLREGQDENSKVIGSTLDMVPVVGLDGSLETILNLIFTDGIYNGSSLAVYGRAVLGATIERAITGGTGIFKLAKGYCYATPVFASQTKLIYEFDVYVWYKQIQ